MKKLNPPQIDFMARVEQSISKLELFVLEARKNNLYIMSGCLLSIQRDLRNALDSQLRAFRDDSLTDPEPLFPHGQFPYGRKTS